MVSDNKSVFWYVLFAANGKAAKITDYLKNANIEYFFPVHYKERRLKDTERKRLVLRPLIGNLVFVKSSINCLESHLREIKLRLNITSDLYYRDLGTRKIIVISETLMQNFIAVAGSTKEHITYLSNDEINFEKGKKIRITGGAFEGVEGIFLRIKGRQHVVVTLPDVLSVAIAFIPTRFIFPLE